MYQDINIKNPTFLSSFIFIILSLLLLYWKQNYFAKVRNFELHICQKSAIKALFHSIFILNSSEKCHNGTFLFFSEKLVHFKLILDCEPKTCTFGTNHTSPWIFVPKQTDFGTFLRSCPEKFLPGSTFARRILCTASAAQSYHSGRYSIVIWERKFTPLHVVSENCQNVKNIAVLR